MRLNERQKMMVALFTSSLLLLLLISCGWLLSDDGLQTNGALKNEPPSLAHWFGTDWLGRDMFTRVLKGLQLSLGVGLLGAIIGVTLAFVLGMLAGTFGGWVDAVIGWCIDLFIGMPHLIFIILIAFSVGGGMKGIVLGVGLTHWPSLARLIRAEVQALRQAEYMLVAEQLGRTKWQMSREHLFPHLFPHLIIGFVLLFPHAILHEAALTFLGFGLSVQTPAIGIILSEALHHISTGHWWLTLIPGGVLLLVVKSFDEVGERLKQLLRPQTSQQ